MRTIALIFVLLSLAACSQTDIARERSYIARCAALGISRVGEPFEQCRSLMQGPDQQLQAEAARGS